MTPQEKNVFGKLFTKTELGTHEIELGLIEDIDKRNKETLVALQKADVSFKEYQNYLTNADKPFKKMIEARQNYLKATTDIGGLLIKSSKLAAELGLNAEDVKGYSALKKNIMTGNEIIDIIDTFKDPSTFQ
jgi:hypothetical protein